MPGNRAGGVRDANGHARIRAPDDGSADEALSRPWWRFLGFGVIEAGQQAHPQPVADWR